MWKYIEVNGINTRYHESGEGSPVVLIHGGDIGSGTADTWDRLIEELEPRHRVIAFDRLASGYTDNPSDEKFRMSAVVEHAASLLKELSVESATVIGQSRGAFVASRIAKLFPELVDRLVIINSATLAVGRPVETLPGMLTYKTYRETFNGDADHDARVMSVTTDHMSEEWVHARKAIAELPKTLEAQGMLDELWDEVFEEFEIIKNDTIKWFFAGKHTKPTLIVWGVGDPTTTARDAVDLFDILSPHVDELRLHMINRCGHWPHREYPQEVGREVLDFVAGTKAISNLATK
jgi:pimeloyl-ACP methyl ester carboxylesterase